MGAISETETVPTIAITSTTETPRGSIESAKLRTSALTVACRTSASRSFRDALLMRMRSRRRRSRARRVVAARSRSPRRFAICPRTLRASWIAPRRGLVSRRASNRLATARINAAFRAAPPEMEKPTSITASMTPDTRERAMPTLIQLRSAFRSLTTRVMASPQRRRRLSRIPAPVTRSRILSLTRVTYS